MVNETETTRIKKNGVRDACEHELVYTEDDRGDLRAPDGRLLQNPLEAEMFCVTSVMQSSEDLWIYHLRISPMKGLAVSLKVREKPQKNH